MSGSRDRGMSIRRKRRLFVATLVVTTAITLLYLLVDVDVYYRRYINTPHDLCSWTDCNQTQTSEYPLPSSSATQAVRSSPSVDNNEMDTSDSLREISKPLSPTPSTTTTPKLPPTESIEEFKTTTSSIPTSTTTVALPTTTDLKACPSHGVVYSQSGGRLGNLMWEYAAAFVVAQRTGLQPFVHPDIRYAMDEVFVNLSVPAHDMKNCANHWSKQAFGDLTNSPNAPSIQIFTFWGPDYGGLVEIIVNHQPDVRQEFKFHPHLVKNAQEVLRAARRNPDTVFVGVHVRRTDYERHLRVLYNTTQANDSFYVNAMNVFRGKYKEAVFLVVSDDIEWCRNHIIGDATDVILVKGTAAEDMATVSACNHTIIDYGTFGEWSSLFAGGETIVYDLRQFNDHTSNLATLKHWLHIR